MQLILQTQYSKMAFEMKPDNVGELIQAAFRYASGMAQLMPGWSNEIEYPDGMEAIDRTDAPTQEEDSATDGPDAGEQENQAPQNTPLADGDQPDSGMEAGEADDEGDGRSYQEGPVDEATPMSQPESGNDGASIGDSVEYESHRDPGWKQASHSDAASQQEATHIQPKRDTQRYAGFLFIQCQHCGKRKGFRTKAPIDTYFCDCGKKTHLENMVPVYAECKCGKSWRYRTNVMDNLFEIDCIACGSPIDLEYNERRGVYTTVQDED